MYDAIIGSFLFGLAIALVDFHKCIFWFK